MKQIVLILFVILSFYAQSQNNSRDLLNLKGDIKSVRQTKYKFQKNEWILESSDKNRFVDILFMSIAQQLLIDNSYIGFTKQGEIKYWFELDSSNDTISKLDFSYNNVLLPYKIEFVWNERAIMTVEYNIDGFGNITNIVIDNMNSQIVRNEEMRVESEILKRNQHTSILKYNYLDDGVIETQMFDGEDLVHTLSTKFNQNGDIEFDSYFNYQYTYDNTGNWITKTGFYDETPVVKHIRKIEYY